MLADVAVDYPGAVVDGKILDKEELVGGEPVAAGSAIVPVGVPA